MNNPLAHLKPGTIKAASRRYRAVLRDNQLIVWTCDHPHATSHEALDCAYIERDLSAKSLGLPS